MMQTGKLTIRRTKQSVNKLRKIQLFLDGTKCYDISDGEEKTFEIPVGKHELLAKIDLFLSRPTPVIIEEDKEKSFELGCQSSNPNLMYNNLIGILILLASGFLSSYLHNALILYITLAILVLIILMRIYFVRNRIYFMAFGRRDYLYLTEV